jgi:hypothetical protein
MRDWGQSNAVAGDMSAPGAARGAGPAREPFSVRSDRRGGLIHTAVQGYWSMGDADAYFTTLRDHIAVARRHSGHARVLTDRRGNPVQSPDVAQRMQRANQELFESTDRLAILVDSRLVEMQIRRLLTHAGSRAFLSFDEALAWLEA